MSEDESRLTTRRRLLAASGSLAAVGLAGCTGDGEDPDDGHDDHDHDDHGHDDDHDDHDHDHGMDLSAFEIIDRSDDEVTAYLHDDHWHDSLPPVPLDDNISLGAYVEDGDGEEIFLGETEEFELRVDYADGANEDPVSFDYHGDHVHIIGEEEGLTEVVFQLWHDDHSDYDTPPITVEVSEDAGEQMQISTFEVIDRSEDEVTAYVDGDHWHGDLPFVPLDDNISLGAYVEDGDGDEIFLGETEEYELRVAVADGADEDPVSFDYHGDHLHIIGESEGETEVVFQLWHDDHSDYDTPPIAAEVVEDPDEHEHDDDHDHDDH